jgi:hypothetical protein
MAIVKSHNYLVWSLTWEDIEEFGKKKPKYKYTNYLDVKYLNHAILKKMLHKNIGFVEKSSMELLMELLTDQTIQGWQERAEAIATAMIKAPYSIENGSLKYSVSDDLYATFFNSETEYYAGIYEDNDVSIFSLGDFAKLSKNSFTDNIFILHIKDKVTRIDFTSWSGTLRMYNVMQFLGNSLFTTQKGIDNAVYDVIGFRIKQHETSNQEWSIVYEEVLPEAKNLVKALSKADQIPIPTVGKEIVDQQQTVLGEAELLWEELKIAVTLDNSFTAEDWTLFHVGESPERIIETLLERIAS